VIVAGIDVGGARKGFHAVLLEGSRVVDQLNTSDPEALARWCLRAERIAIDAPCGWALPGERSRLCERQLAAQGVRCFATPTREAALASRSNFYGWVLRGEALYQALQRYRVPIARDAQALQGRCSFESFPHGITVALSPQIEVKAAFKLEQRSALLERFGVSLSGLSSIDWIDAAVCALAGQHIAKGAEAEIYGEPEGGLLVLPGRTRHTAGST
jgi:predicted RNase H-like nuclease